MAIDKAWALNSLRHQRNSCVVSLAGLMLLNSDRVNELDGKVVVVRPGEIIFGANASDRSGTRLEIPLSRLANEYSQDPQRYCESLYEHWKHSRRNLVKECFETVKAYARATGQEHSLNAAPWFGFARVIRNCISHDLHFRFRRWDLANLPVSYLDATIDASMQGAQMLDSHLDHYAALSLHGDMEAWTNKH